MGYIGVIFQVDPTNPFLPSNENKRAPTVVLIGVNPKSKATRRTCHDLRKKKCMVSVGEICMEKRVLVFDEY